MFQNYQQYQVQRIQYVNGRKSAELYQMMPNQEAILMDSEEPVFYIKTTDAAGSAVIKEYEFTERAHVDPAQAGMEEIKERLKRLEFLFEGMKGGQNESNFTKPAEQHQKPV